MFKTYILTLRGARDEALQRKVRELSSGLGDIEVVQGVDGRELPAGKYYNIMLGARWYSERGQILSPGEVGCALSHLRMLQDFLNSKAQIAIIFEDDVIIEEQSVDKLQKALQFIRPADILVACDQRGVYSDNFQDNFRVSPLEGRTECYAVQKDDWIIVKRTCAYALGREAAKHVVSVQNEALCQADDYQALCPDDGRLLFCNAFSHLATFDGSTIDIERQLQRGRPRQLILRLKDELMKTAVRKVGPARRAIRSALSGYRSIGK